MWEFRERWEYFIVIKVSLINCWLLLTACTCPHLILSLVSGYLMGWSSFSEHQELSVLSSTEQLKNTLALSSNPHPITAQRGPMYSWTKYNALCYNAIMDTEISPYVWTWCFPCWRQRCLSSQIADRKHISLRLLMAISHGMWRESIYSLGQHMVLSWA